MPLLQDRILTAVLIALLLALAGLAVADGGVADGPRAKLAPPPSTGAPQPAPNDEPSAVDDGTETAPPPSPSLATPPESRPAPRASDGCILPRRVQRISFSATKYPSIRRHYLRAVRRGWPRVLILNRRGADERRDELLARYATRDGFDRDEYPPAIARGAGRWRAHVAYVPSGENRSHGARLGLKLRRFCDGTRFRYVFY